MKWSSWFFASLLALGTAGAIWWHLTRESAIPNPTDAIPPSSSVNALSPTPGVPWFEEVAAASGITFRHYDSATPRQYIQETLGSGLAWIDYNRDGWPDLFCVQ